jgi:hypothetical protein
MMDTSTMIARLQDNSVGLQLLPRTVTAPPARQRVDKARQRAGTLIWINTSSATEASFEGEVLQRQSLREAAQFMLTDFSEYPSGR